MTITVSSPDRTAERAAALAELKAACRRHGITQDEIAAKTEVTRPAVVNTFAGRTVSRRIVETAQGLVAEAEKRLARARSRKRQADGDGA